MSGEELPDPWAMSDEDYLANEGQFAESIEQSAEDSDDTTGVELSESGDEENADVTVLSDEDAEEDVESDDESSDSDDAGDDADPSADDDLDSDDDDDADDSADDGDSEDSEDEDTDDQDEVTPEKDFFEKVTAPFKANGKEMRIEDPDDVIRLMQMGANYNRKMASMKPHLKVLKTLEKANLLDESKLNFLIDLDQKNPEAIAQLVRDAEIDPMEIKTEDAGEYKASDHSVDDRELALDEVVDEIRDTDTYNKTLDVVSNKWDASSRKIVATTPQLMKVINDHMASGVYDIISTAVERERTLGRLSGLSDIEAYRSVGDRIDSEGGFAHLFQAEQGSQDTPDRTPKKAKRNDKKRKAARRAASPSKAAAEPASAPDFNPLAMTDEEFLKQSDDRFL